VGPRLFPDVAVTRWNPRRYFTTRVHQTRTTQSPPAVMGWKCSQHAKQLALPGAFNYVPDKSGQPDVIADVAVFDVNAWARARYMVGTNPPVRVANSLVSLALATKAKAITFCWDRQANMLPARDAVHSERSSASKIAPPDDTEMATVTTVSMGTVEWNRVLASSKTKAAGYALVVKAIKEAVLRRAPDDVVVTMIDPAGGDPWVFPAGVESPAASATTKYAYGEADAQVAMTVAEHITRAATSGTNVPKTVVFTNDGDMLIQLMGIWPRNVKVVIAKVWATDETVHRTAASAAKKEPGRTCKPMWEVVNMNATIRPRAEMASKIVWCLLAKGVDYCKGICKFGWKQEDLVSTLAERGRRIVKFTPLGAVVDMAKLRSILAHNRGAGKRLETSSRPGGGAHNLSLEMERVLFCLRYYVWFDAARPHRAGPLEQPNTLASPGGSVSQWVSNGPSTAVLTNEYPAGAELPTVSSAHADDVASLRHYLS